MNPFENLNPAPNIAGIIQQGFERGQARRKEADSQNALTQYALDPDAPGSFEGLARTNPQAAIQARNQRMQQQRALLEQHREDIGLAAKIIGAIKPQDQAGWDQARALAQQSGIDLSQVPPQFDPQYVQNLMQINQALNPQKDNNPSSVQEYQFAKQQGFQGTYMNFLETKRGPIVANNGDGTFQIIPRGMVQQQGGPQVGSVEDGYRFKGGNPADPNSWEPVNGGPTPQASGGFPSSGY